MSPFSFLTFAPRSKGTQTVARLLAAGLLAALCAAASAQTPMRGVLISLTPQPEQAMGASDAARAGGVQDAAKAAGVRDAAKAARVHSRMQALLADVALPQASSRALGEQMQVLTFAQPLSGAPLEQAMRRLRLHPDVASVEPDVRLKPLATPNDASFAQQWYLAANRPAALNATAAWDKTTGTAAITVAVLDSGIRPHPDLEGRTVAGYDFVSQVEYANDGNGRDTDPTDPGDWVSAADQTASPNLFGSCDVARSSWHGTFIAGLIGARTNNGVGVAGVNWNSRVLPVRVAGKCGALLSDLLDGMRWAAGLSVVGAPVNANPARVINISFGGDRLCAGSGYQTVIDEVTARGAVVVVAGGNESRAPTRPADCNNVLAVGAVRADGAKTTYSSLGERIGITAPGGSTEAGSANMLFNTLNTGLQGPTTESYGTKQGTSFSAPLAAGVAALMLGVNPQLTPAEVIARIKASATPHTFDATLPNCSAAVTGLCNCNTTFCGAGLLNADRAVARAFFLTAQITGPASVEEGSLIRLDAANTTFVPGQTPPSYTWTQTGGPTAAIATPNAVATTVQLPRGVASYTFALRVRDDGGRTSDASITIATTAAPVITPPIAGGGSTGGGGGALGWLDLAALLALAAYLMAMRSKLRVTK